MRIQSPHSWSNKGEEQKSKIRRQRPLYLQRSQKSVHTDTHCFLIGAVAIAPSAGGADQRRLNYLFGKLGVPIICGGLVATGWSRARTLGRVCSCRSATSITRSRSLSLLHLLPTSTSPRRTLCPHHVLWVPTASRSFRYTILAPCAYKCYSYNSEFDFMSERKWNLLFFPQFISFAASILVLQMRETYLGFHYLQNVF